MPRFNATLAGAREFDAFLERQRGKIDDGIALVIRRVTGRVWNAAKNAAPRSGGRPNRFGQALHRSITREIFPRVGIVGTDDPRGLWLEFGTKTRRTRSGASRGRLRPQPWLGPAFERHTRQLDDELVKAVELK